MIGWGVSGLPGHQKITQDIFYSDGFSRRYVVFYRLQRQFAETNSRDKFVSRIDFANGDTQTISLACSEPTDLPPWSSGGCESDSFSEREST